MWGACDRRILIQVTTLLVPSSAQRVWARAIDADPSHHYAHLALGKMYKVQFTAAKNQAKSQRGKKTGTKTGTMTGKKGGTTKGASAGAGAGAGAGAVSRLLVSASRHFAAAARLAPLLAEPLRDHATLLLLVEGGDVTGEEGGKGGGTGGRRVEGVDESVDESVGVGTVGEALATAVGLLEQATRVAPGDTSSFVSLGVALLRLKEPIRAGERDRDTRESYYVVTCGVATCMYTLQYDISSLSR